MRKNKYFKKEKEYLRLRRELDNNRDAQIALGYVKLENPVPHGWNAYYVLRKDVSHREDAWVFQAIIDLCGRDAWRRKNNFETVKERRVKAWQNKAFYDYPHFNGINEERYKILPPAIQKWLAESIDNWGRKSYHSNVPNFFFEVKVEQNFKTHAKVIDNVLLQEEAEIEESLELIGRNYNWFYGCGTVPKSYVRFFNVSDRRLAKLSIHNFIYNKKEDPEFPGRHRHSAGWSYW